MLFDEPVYGVIGGPHYPVTASPLVQFGLPVQRIASTGKWPWDPINRQDVETAIAYLQRRHPQLIALSPHDSCDWSIDAFRQAFGGSAADRRADRPHDGGDDEESAQDGHRPAASACVLHALMY